MYILFHFDLQYFKVTIRVKEIGNAPRLNLQSFTVPGNWRFQQLYNFLKDRCNIPNVPLKSNQSETNTNNICHPSNTSGSSSRHFSLANSNSIQLGSNLESKNFVSVLFLLCDIYLNSSFMIIIIRSVV